MAVPVGLLTSTEHFFLGADCDVCPAGTVAANSDVIDGAIDEVRLETVPRSPAWLAVQVAFCGASSSPSREPGAGRRRRGSLPIEVNAVPTGAVTSLPSGT
jgi:hypothetical protein